jgi:hypothetical protein
MQRVIVLANGKQIPLGAYVAGVRGAIQNPTRTYSHGLCGWWPVSGAEIRHEFLRGLYDRINRTLTIRDDRRTAARHLRYVKEHGRECAWCGQRFFPKILADRCCSTDCLRCYRG